MIPPLSYYVYGGNYGDINPYGREFIGSYRKSAGLKFAKRLRKDGFKVIIRGRGPRKKYHKARWEKEKDEWMRDHYDEWGTSKWKGKLYTEEEEHEFRRWKRQYLDYLPIKYATHVALYIPPFHERQISEERTECPVCHSTNLLQIVYKENLVWTLEEARPPLKIKLVMNGLPTNIREIIKENFTCKDCEKTHNPHLGSGRVICTDGSIYLYDFQKECWWCFKTAKTTDNGRINSLLETL